MLNDHDILDNLADALAECPEPGETIYSTPDEWPFWCDVDTWELGPDDYHDLVDDPDLYHGLVGEDEPIFDADDMMLDMLERMTLERETCNARWVD